MKKLFPIVLIAILLLNVMGYYGIFLGLQYQNDVAMKKRLDSDRYDESHTITISIPLSVPYMNDDADFKRVDGIFEHQGEYYRLVKQKYAKDTLTVICVKDLENKRIREALHDVAKNFTDKPTDHQQHAKLTITFLKDYLPQTFSLKTRCPGWQNDVLFNTNTSNLTPTFSATVIHPPERG